MDKKYYSLNFKRTKNHLLDNENLNKKYSDFEIRRMLIDDYNNNLHVIFSIRMVAKFITILFIFLCFLTMIMNYGNISITFGIFSLIFLFIRFIYINKYKKILRIFIMSVGFLDMDIKKKYNMDMPNIF